MTISAYPSLYSLMDVRGASGLKPLTSIATANWSALSRAELKSGIKRLVRLLSLPLMFPLRKLAPLAVCAMINFSSSSRRTGINLSETDIIRLNSATGKRKALRGVSSFSTAYVIWTEEVVRVSRDEARTTKRSLRQKKRPLSNP